MASNRIGRFKQECFELGLEMGELIDVRVGAVMNSRDGEQRQNALCPMVVRRADGTDRCIKEEDLRERVVH